VLADQAKARVEQAIRDSGIPFTIFRPTYFMDNLPKHLQGKRAIALGEQLLCWLSCLCVLTHAFQ